MRQAGWHRRVIDMIPVPAVNKTLGQGFIILLSPAALLQKGVPYDKP